MLEPPAAPSAGDGCEEGGETLLPNGAPEGGRKANLGVRWALRAALGTALVMAVLPTLPSRTLPGAIGAWRLWPQSVPEAISGGAVGGTITAVAAIPRQPSPSLFCFSFILLGSYEVSLVQMQLRANTSIFACDDQAVFSTGLLTLGTFHRGVVETILIDAVDAALVQSHGCATASHSACNTGVFIEVWRAVQKDGRFRSHDWTMKVDADAVFFPQRLRPKLQPHTTGERSYVWNLHCWDFLQVFGPLEILSTAALEFYLENSEPCNAFPWAAQAWGEDFWLQTCMQALGIPHVDLSGILSDGSGACSRQPCWDKSRVAYHAFKGVQPYLQCYQQSLPYVGCFVNDGANRRGGHRPDLTLEACDALALEGSKPFFGMEYPQGSADGDKAGCLPLGALPEMQRADDAACEGKVFEGNRLGSALRLAVYMHPAGCSTEPDGCFSIKDEMQCLTSRDGRDWVGGEPCVWCGGANCTSDSGSKCEPMDWLLRGEGKYFGKFLARDVYTVSICQAM